MVDLLFGKEAKLKYIAGQYQVLELGDFVICSVTGNRIPVMYEKLYYCPRRRLDNLAAGNVSPLYWNVELQEVYASVEVGCERHKELQNEL